MSVSPRSIRALVASGRLRRVAIPGANGQEMRRVLIDRADLDWLIERWKDGGPEAVREGV